MITHNPFNQTVNQKIASDFRGKALKESLLILRDCRTSLINNREDLKSIKSLTNLNLLKVALDGIINNKGIVNNCELAIDETKSFLLALDRPSIKFKEEYKELFNKILNNTNGVLMIYKKEKL
jgi:hypothetical protein